MSGDSLQRILVTGGTGFIGRYLVKKLVGEGHKPYVLSRNAPTVPAADINFVKLDLLDHVRLEEWIKKNQPEIIIHLAGATLHNDVSGKACHDLNYAATIHLLSSARKVGLRRMIMLGTAEEYGNQPTPFTEEMKPAPTTAYGISKSRATEYAISEFEASGLPVVILRAFTAYGYGQPPQMFLSQLISHALLRKNFNMTDGIQKRDFVYVEDIVEAIVSALSAQNVEGRVINIGSGKSTALRDVAEKVWAICGSDRSQLHIGERFKPVYESYDTEADVSLAAKLLRWKPETEFNAGLHKTIEMMKHNFSA